MRFDPESCSAMNIRYSKQNVARLRKKGFLVGHFDRRLEPKRMREMEGFSLEWGVGEVLGKADRVPDVIYDEGTSEGTDAPGIRKRPHGSCGEGAAGSRETQRSVIYWIDTAEGGGSMTPEQRLGANSEVIRNRQDDPCHGRQGGDFL